MKTLHLGCGLSKIDGAVNHDISRHSEHVDVAHDLDVTPWPWADGEFGRIVALDVFEHLSSPVESWLNECHRILSDGGESIIRVPHYLHENAYTDPTHKRFFTTKTFDYWDMDKELHKKYGCFYYGQSASWWSVASVSTDGVNIQFLLKRRTK